MFPIHLLRLKFDISKPNLKESTGKIKKRTELKKWKKTKEIAFGMRIG